MNRRRSAALAILLVSLALALAACGGAAADTPSGAVRTALDRVAAKDLEGLEALTCEAAGDTIREQLGLPGDLGGEILPGIDANAVLDAVELDTSDLTIGDETIDGDAATVAVRGTIEVSFDAEAIRPLVRQLLEAQGAELSDAQLDAMLGLLERSARELPVNQAIELVREDGAWKLCSIE